MDQGISLTSEIRHHPFSIGFHLTLLVHLLIWQHVSSWDINLPRDYNKYKLPQRSDTQNNFVNGSMHSLPVDVNLFVYTFSSISVVDMDYTIDFMLRQRWVDQRLKGLVNESLGNIPINHYKNHLWMPDLFFRNSKRGFLHDVTQPNYLIWIDHTGTITYSQKLSVKASCHMHLSKFPMDTQSCKLNMGSYGYARRDLEFRWWGSFDESSNNSNYPVNLRKDLEINEFLLVSRSAYDCEADYSSTGSFACLEVEFRLQRRFGFYLIYAYLPSLLIDVIAWVSFFIDSEAVPARVSIGLLCVLALITQSAAVLSQLPRVSYIKAIDVWVFTSLAFVVTSLLEFAIANSLSRKRIAKQTIVATEIQTFAAGNDRPHASYDQVQEGSYKQCATQNTTGIMGHRPAHFDAARRIDTVCGILYPILFSVFNLFYWLHYVVME